jgi:hypothetical protein
MSSPSRADIKAAAQRGQISRETMAKALEGDTRVLAWTQWLIDGNDGPQGPPEDWRAAVTAETLTDAMLYDLRRHLRNAGDFIACNFVAIALERDEKHPVVVAAKQYAITLINAPEYAALRAAINARREGSK